MRKVLAPRLLFVALLVIGALLALVDPVFLTATNLINVLRQISINGIMAVGVTIVLLTGGVDLSLGSVAALSGVVAAGCAHPGSSSVFAAVAAGMLTGTFCGLLNGLIVTGGRVPSFIATLGMMTAARGIALVLSGGRPVSDLSRGFTDIAAGHAFGVPHPVIIFAAAALAANLFLNRFRLGRHLYAVGGNETAAHASGIRVAGVKVFAYSACGTAAGLAGVVLASRVTTGQPNAAVGYELDAIAAAVIGGTSLSGGVGRISGTILGALLMGVINNGLDLLNVSSYYQQVVKGLIIVGAVGLEMRTRK